MKVVHCRRCRGERLPHVAGIRCVLPSAPHDIRCMEAAASPESSVRPLVMSLRKVVLPLSCYYVRCRFFLSQTLRHRSLLGPSRESEISSRSDVQGLTSDGRCCNDVRLHMATGGCFSAEAQLVANVRHLFRSAAQLMYNARWLA